MNVLPPASADDVTVGWSQRWRQGPWWQLFQKQVDLLSYGNHPSVPMTDCRRSRELPAISKSLPSGPLSTPPDPPAPGPFSCSKVQE
jgi:hypothetical protein